MGLNGGIRLFKIFGITVFLHWTWFLLAAYEVQSRKGDYGSVGWNIAEYLALFAIVLMHEFGHALACRSVGGKAERIILWPLGGVAFVSPPPRPGAVLWSLAAGPLVNVALLPLTLPLLWLPVNTDLNAFLHTIGLINLMLLLFNMLPIFPLDGGQILQALLWYVIGYRRSLLTASIIGLLGAAAMALFGVYFDQYWFIILAVFAGMNSWSAFNRAKTLAAREAVVRRQGVACPACGKSPPMGQFWICSTCHARFDAFDHRQSCPGCGKPHHWTTCLDCGTRAPYAAWDIAPQMPPPPAAPPSTPTSPAEPPPAAPPPEPAGTGQIL